MPDRRHDFESSRHGHGRDRQGRDPQRGQRYQTGSERDRYETGRERRYTPDWDRDTLGSAGGYEGNRGYSRGGYSEEVGFRGDDFPRGDQSQGASYRRDDFRGRPETGYSDFEREWAHDTQGEQYYGTGSHYGGGFGTAPSSRASAAGVHGAPGYAGEGAWSDRTSDDWLPESGAGGRSTSGSYENYGRSLYGAQSGFGRDYGRPGEQSQASFRGRGPKGYTRSDERLKETICELLTDDPRIDAREIEIEVQQQAVTVKGSVPDRRTKYAVEELVENCGGVRDIDNQLRVSSSRWPASG